MVTKLQLVREGSTSLLVPESSMRSRAPETYPVFFNPAARINRDVSVAVTNVTRPATFLDVLAGVGARGVRVAKEGPAATRVTMVDFNAPSVTIARKNIAKNRVGRRCSVIRSEANAFLHSRFGRPNKFAFVDVDPFGTPAPYVQGALIAAADGGTVSLTATDTAVLCGTYPSVALRRYGAHVTRSEFMHEAAARVLFGFCVRMGGVLDLAIAPILAHSTLHYLRVYMHVTRGSAPADAAVRDLGYVSSCASCHEVTVSKTHGASCEKCGSGKVRVIGPQWIGGMVDEGLARDAALYCAQQGWKESTAVLRSLGGMDAFPPFSFSLEHIASREGWPSVPLSSVMEALRSNGHRVMRQPFGGQGLKTDASYAAVLGAVRGCSKEYPRQTR